MLSKAKLSRVKLLFCACPIAERNTNWGTKSDVEKLDIADIRQITKNRSEEVLTCQRFQSTFGF